MLNGFDSSASLAMLVAAQCFGVFCAAAARLSEGRVLQAVSRWLFFAALSMVAAATAIAYTVGPGIWIACATSFAVMVLMVTCDFNVDRPLARWHDHTVTS